ncbi:APC family permease [Croceicoccus sediminis]|uniref:APC family permease n=1 Tax=Croceicoccus sediminis TaxID=2571150 RepID=UPI001F0EAFC3|nr:APC family permease [Croceicoccus sediminis]
MTRKIPAQSQTRKALGLPGAWAMAVGGMIGGGIFSTLGVVIQVAGQWAWASFLIGGLIAWCSGHSYAELTVRRDQPGGSYGFLRDIGRTTVARWLMWVLIAGYTLTVAVYGFTFGAYAANALNAPGWAASAAAVGAIAILAGVNLLGATQATIVELFAVFVKLVILLGLAALGIWHWAPERLVLETGDPVGPLGALAGVGVVFMAYEGFQLLSYDYDEMKDAKRTIRRAMSLAIIATCATYVLVALGATMLAGAPEIVAKEEVALAQAGRAALGAFGFVAVSIAAAFSTASAINATVFATARLAGEAAGDGELPAIFGRRNARDVPWAGVMVISGVAMVLAIVGGIEQLVEGASFVFLGVFALVNVLAWRGKVRMRWLSGVGAVTSILAAAALVLYVAGLA